MKTLLLAVFLLTLGAHAEPPPGYRLVWAEEFDGTTEDLDKSWVFQNGPSGHILSSRWRENVVVTNGLCRLINRKESRGGQAWTSGNIWTREQFQYGYFECRYRYAAARGTNNSFWLMPTTPPPPGKKRFEIDINEGHFPNKLNTNIHNHSDQKVVNGRRTHPTAHKSFTFKEQDFARDFHVFALEWTEQELVWFLDGKEIRREKNEFCHGPAAVWVSLAVIKWAGPVTDDIDRTAMEVDWVRVYQCKP